MCAKVAMTRAEIREAQAQGWFASSDFRKASAKVSSAQRAEPLQRSRKENKRSPNDQLHGE